MRPPDRPPLAALLCYVLGATAAAAAPATAPTDTPTPRPAVVETPAEAYLGELAQRADVLPLAFHVDYWDELGWRDRFEVAGAVPRQQTYARALRLASIYTPEVVIDGHDGDIRIDVGALHGTGPCDVVAIGYRRSAVSVIGRGENAGRTLTEFNIVRSVHSVGTWNGEGKTYHAVLSSLPADATDIAVVVQAAGQSAILGAASHTLR